MAFRVTPAGSFSLQAAGDFAQSFPGTDATVDVGLRISWALDGDWRVVTVVLRQPGAVVTGELVGRAADGVEALARRDVERFLSLDVDGAGFDVVCARDPTLAAARHAVGGLRPVLFFTPYEAAAWTVIGHRIQMRQAAAIRRRLAAELGTRGAFPEPSVLAELPRPQPGLTEVKVDRLRELGAAAGDGRLDRDRLRAMDEDAALEAVQELPGIGPFSAELILIRGVGAPDRLPTRERRIEALVAERYAGADLATVAEGWRPYRSWAATVLRASA